VEEAMGYKSLMDEYKLTRSRRPPGWGNPSGRGKRAAPFIAAAEGFVSRKAGTLSAGTPRTLLSLSDKGKIETIADVITRKSFSVRNRKAS
jgi:hypothetical protein